MLAVFRSSVTNVHVGHDITQDKHDGNDDGDGKRYGEGVAGELAALLGAAVPVLGAGEGPLYVTVGEAVYRMQLSSHLQSHLHHFRIKNYHSEEPIPMIIIKECPSPKLILMKV